MTVRQALILLLLAAAVGLVLPSWPLWTLIPGTAALAAGGLLARAEWRDQGERTTTGPSRTDGGRADMGGADERGREG